MPSKKNGAERPTITEINPRAALPGGDFQIRGKHLMRELRPAVTFGGVSAPVVVGSPSYVVARVPEGADAAPVVVSNGDAESLPETFDVGVLMADNLHPVASPAVDRAGNVFTTFSGQRGQKTPVAVYQVDAGGSIVAYLTDVMNATGLAFNSRDVLYISSRFDGVVYESSASGVMSVYVEGMGVATGIAFDAEDNLYVGDRSGTIFKVSPERQIYVFATLEPSIAAYHLCFGPGGFLYVTGPTTSSFDSIHRISPAGEVETFHRGFGRPQGMAFDSDGNLYVAASLAGRKGIVQITPEREASLYLSGPNIVGLAFTPRRDLVITTTSALYRLHDGHAPFVLS